MIPNNNYSVLPWYESLEQQNARKWWIYQQVYPLFTPARFLLPWQLIIQHSDLTPQNILNVSLYDAQTGRRVISGLESIMQSMVSKVEYASRGYDVWVFGGQFPVFSVLANGQYYMEMTIDKTYYSEVFTVVNDISPYLKVEWWDIEDFVMDEGTITYRYAGGTQFKNVLYLQADIAKPEYSFEEEGETRDGYFFPAKQISEKHYRFNFFASEYLLDVMRFIRMADYAYITKSSQQYKLDTFLITPEWEDNGDVANVLAEFDTATVAKKIGRAREMSDFGGDFNNDFNSDFNND